MSDQVTTQTAERIAAGGRDALTARLQAAFAEEARAADVTVAGPQLEALVTAAAQRADPVLWRRALADAACAELGVSLPEAVLHPVVEHAQELVGAPPWSPPSADDDDAGDDGDNEPQRAGDAPGEVAPAEDSELGVPIDLPEPTTEPSGAAMGAGAAGAAPASDEPEAGKDPVTDAGVTGPTGPESPRAARRSSRRREAPSRTSSTPAPPRRAARETPGGRAGRTAAAAEEERQALRLAAVHLGGIETVRPGDRDIELRLSAAGLDVLRRSSGAAIGRLEWHEIQTVDLPRARRGLRPGRRRVQELHVTTERGQASFELPGLTEEQVHEHLEPMLDRQGVARAQP